MMDDDSLKIYNNYKQILLEMPVRTSDVYDNSVNGFNDVDNKDNLSRIEGISPIRVFDYNNIVVSLYEIKLNQDFGDYLFMDMKTKTTLAEFSFGYTTDGGIITDFITNDVRRVRGIIRYFVLNILPDLVNYMLSDVRHTQSGENYWKKLYADVKNSDVWYFCVFNYSTNEYEEFDEKLGWEYYYNNGEHYSFALVKN